MSTKRSCSTHSLSSEVGSDNPSQRHSTGPMDSDTEEEESSISEERSESHSESTDSESECLSLCCKDNSRPCQPANKIVISSLAKNGRNFMERWYQQFPWLTVCTIRKKVFCFYCRKAEKNGLMSITNKAEPTFTKVGFDNWKKAIQKYRAHSQCDAHREAVLKCQMIQSTPINSMLSTQAKKIQQDRRQALLKQLNCLRFLLRQGLAIRGHDEIQGNLHQLLLMCSADDPCLSKWVHDNTYSSPLIINEFITLMGLSVLRSFLSKVKECKPAWYSIIVDEATDVANKEQLNLSIPWVDSDYGIREDPVGLYCLPNTKADTLYEVVTDILTRCGLPLPMCKGQALDGASNMQVKRNGLAVKIKKEVPAALSLHCLAHCLNLCLQDAGRKVTVLRDALELVLEIAKLIRFSPKRAHLFSKNLAESESEGVTIKPLCPTRWTARTGAIGAVLSDYSVLMKTLDEVHQTTHDEYGLKAAGLLAALDKFLTLFGLKLSYLLFGASETLSKSLQGKDTTLQEALSSVNLAKAFYTRQRTDNSFTQFYKDVVDTAIDKNIGKPELPRYRRAPARLENGSLPHRFGMPEEFYRHLYFEACDLLIRELDDRFQVEESLSPVLSLENLLLQAANGESYEDVVQSLQSSCYKDDINFNELQKQLPLLVDLIRQAHPKVSKVTSIRTICEAMNTQNVYKSMLSEVHNLLRLYLTVPITSATSEKNTYLPSLNYV